MVTPSIKDLEHKSRSSVDDEEYIITGPEQKKPRNWLNALRNSSFKTTLVAFLIRYWANDHVHTFISQKKLYVTCENDCYLFTANNNCVQTTNCANLYSTHQEANSKMLSHIAFIPSPANIVIRSVDTDVLVIALACLSTIDRRKKVWMETGMESKNSQSYININQIYQTLGEQICRGLPALHAFTGSNYTSSFSRKGNVVRPLKLLEKDRDAQQAFAIIAEDDFSDGKILVEIDKFTCKLYCTKRLASVDEARLEMFLRNYEIKNLNKSLTKIKKLDATTLPPCSKVLHNKILRTKFVSSMWVAATLSSQPQMDQESFGWKLANGSYQIPWFDGEESPKV